MLRGAGSPSQRIPGKCWSPGVKYPEAVSKERGATGHADRCANGHNKCHPRSREASARGHPERSTYGHAKLHPRSVETDVGNQDRDADGYAKWHSRSIETIAKCYPERGARGDTIWYPRSGETMEKTTLKGVHPDSNLWSSGCLVAWCSGRLVGWLACLKPPGDRSQNNSAVR